MSFPANIKSLLSEMRKFNWIKKAIFRFRQNSKFRRPDCLKKIHYQILGDLISEQKNTAHEKKSDQVKHFFIKIFYFYNGENINNNYF